MHTPAKFKFSKDDIRRMRIQGHLVVPFPDPDLLKKHAATIFDGLEAMGSNASMQKILAGSGHNKGTRGQLLPGCFEKSEDRMLQCNLDTLGDGLILDYLQSIQGADFWPFFKAFLDLNGCARQCLVPPLARAIDALVAHYQEDGEYKSIKRSIVDLSLDSATITSGTRYRAGTSAISRINTAAFAFYWLTEKNREMYILNSHGEIIDLSGAETDRPQIVVVPGDELSLALDHLIGASILPTVPERDGIMCLTLRTFVYFEPILMDRLAHERKERNKALV